MTRTYVHALRYRSLNRFYDLVVRLLTREQVFRQLMLSKIHVQPGESLLDLGCGSGTLALMIKAANPEVKVHGLDGDADMLGRARCKSFQGDYEVAWHHSDARQLPFADNCFTQVVSSLFFHHLDHASRALVLRETSRVLRPGGALLITDWGPAADSLQWLASWPVRLLDGLSVTRDNFTGILPEMLIDAGFESCRELSVVRTPAGTLRMLGATAPT